MNVTELTEFGVFGWTLLLRQDPPSSSILDSPITVAALLSLFAGALVHFIPRIATALVKVIESLAGVVEETYRGRKARTDAMIENTDQVKQLFDQLQIETARAGKAIETSIEAIRSANQANEQTRIANEQAKVATARIESLLTEKHAAEQARIIAEKNLEYERQQAADRIEALELRIAALTAGSKAPPEGTTS